MEKWPIIFYLTPYLKEQMKNLISFHKEFISSIIYIDRMYLWEKNLKV